VGGRKSGSEPEQVKESFTAKTLSPRQGNHFVLQAFAHPDRLDGEIAKTAERFSMISLILAEQLAV
jgi:hypothetical protein